MKLSMRSLLAPSLALSLSLSAPLALAQSDESVKNWQMFAHFINVARPDQAKPFGEKLLALDNAEFLAAIEKDRLHKFDEVATWGINDALRPTWEKIEDKYQEALTQRSRNPEQIRADIKDLGGVNRQEFLAIQRLKETGQFAAPYFLEVLQDSGQSRLHPRVINAMIEVGSELTYPLSIALANVDPTTQVYIARVVGEIGYPEALPYLKVVAESDADSNVKRACQAAFTQIAESSGVDATGSPAELFVKIGQAKYGVGTREDELLGMDLANETGIVWRYNTDAGLVPIAVPERVYADVLAMQNAVSALSLEPEMADAVTLHLTSNLRRENRLAGDADTSYTLPNPASFYLLVSGAPQQKAVLTRALTDGDPALSLDAIEAMAKTVGNNVLLGSEDTKAPVLDALYFADRRVRYTAAITLASAQPAEAFPGSVSVVPVLGQAVRQSDTLNAMVVAPGGRGDALQSAMENIEYKAVADVDLDRAANKAAAAMPGVDLIVYTGDFDGFEAMYAAAQADGTLGVAPILALVPDGVASAITINYPGVQTAAPVADTVNDDELDRLERLAKKTIETYGGEPIGADEALAYANASLAQLKSIASTQSIYNAQDVEPILVEALDDDRPSVATGAAAVLELIDSAQAQQGLADAALGRVGEVQIAMLDALAESAKAHGNKLSRESIDSLIELVNTATGNTALSAARALGALTERPTSDTTGFILGQ
ncbi:MAG: HEAT repeat domain-containing protein [Phycisphaeraceae bacterium]